MYSTCSLNSIENEVVVVVLLKECDGVLEFFDVSDELLDLKCSFGLCDW